jgi:hypothetical protein
MKPSCTYSAFHSIPDSAVTGPVGIRYDSMSAPTLRQGGQSDHTVSVWQVTPITFDPCTLAAVPTMDFHDTPDL